LELAVFASICYLACGVFYGMADWLGHFLATHEFVVAGEVYGAGTA